MASMDARETAAPAGDLGKVRVLVRPIGAGSLSPRCAKSRSPYRRWRPLRLGHRRRRNRRTGAGLHGLFARRGLGAASRVKPLLRAMVPSGVLDSNVYTERLFMSSKKTAIITGASGGIGAGLVEGFLGE